MMNNSAIIRWGIIGCGNVTEIKSGPAYQLTNGFELSAVMRRDPVKLLDYAQRHNISHHTTNAEELIHNDAIDAIYIATPPDSHKHYALKVAQAGKICCIEKPLAPNYKDCTIITNTFQAKQLPLFVAYYRRSLPRFNQVKSWLTNNLIGDIRHVSWRFSKPANDIDLSKKYNWRTDTKIAHGGYFDDLASHGLDLFTYLLGNIIDAKGIITNQQNLYSAKDAISACWIHENKTTGSAYWNFGSNERIDQVEIIGNKGSIEFSVFGEVPLTLNTNKDSKKVFLENPKHIQLYHVQNMQKHLSNTALHPSSGKSATHTAWVMDKILGI